MQTHADAVLGGAPARATRALYQLDNCATFPFEYQGQSPTTMLLYHVDTFL